MPYAAGLAAAVTAAVTIAGCTAESPMPPATTSPVTPTSASTTAAGTTTSTTTVAPTSTGPAFPAGLPEAAKKKNKAGAEAFVRHFVSVVNASWRDPDPEGIRALCSGISKSCDRYVSLAEDMKAKGRRYSGDAVRVARLTSLGDVNGAKRIFASVDVLGARVVAKDGTVVSQDKSETVKNMFFVIWGPVGWVIQEVRNV